MPYDLTSPLQDLPNDALTAIFKHLPLSTRLGLCERICRRWMGICRSLMCWERIDLGKDLGWLDKVCTTIAVPYNL